MKNVLKQKHFSNFIKPTKRSSVIRVLRKIFFKTLFSVCLQASFSRLRVRKANRPCHAVFDAILTIRQTREKFECLYENLMSNNFRKTAVLKKISVVN